MGSLSLTIQFTCRGLACHKANIADCYHLSSTLSAIISLLLRKKRDSVLACHKANIADCSHLSSTLSAILSLLLSKMERRLTRASKCVSVALFIFAAAFMVLPTPNSLNSINIVTNEVSTISNCEKYTIHITSNGKFYIENLALLIIRILILGSHFHPSLSWRALRSGSGNSQL